MTDYRILPSKVTPITRIAYEDTWTEVDMDTRCDVCLGPLDLNEGPVCDECTGLAHCPDDICHGIGYCMHRADSWRP